MSITLSALQKQRRDTAANWTAENPTLLAGEIGLESDTGYWKVGNGSSAWNSLAYVPGLGAELPVSRLADGAARQLLQTDAAGTGVEWTSNVDVPGTLDVTGAATFDSSVTITGDLTVNGTTTNINTRNLVVEDKNVILGDVATPTDVTADGGGITLKGATDKTINWVDATDAWTLSEHVDIASSKEYRINGTKVLDATSLGSSVLITSSNITDGTIVDGDVNASAAIAGTKISPDFGSQNVTTTGTATAAALIPSGSSVPTNGVYLPSANNVAISTNGTGRLFVDSSGDSLFQGQVFGRRVAGSGRLFVERVEGSYTSPTAVGGANVGALIGRGYDGTQFRETGNITFVSEGPITSSSSPGSIVLAATPSGSTAPQERLRITSDGKLGLGTSSPGAILHSLVSSASTVFLGSHGNTGIDFYVNDSTGEARVTTKRIGGAGGKFLSFYTDTGSAEAERVRITSGGNVGIGTTTVAGKLHTVLDTGFTAGGSWTSATAVFGGATSLSGALGIAYDDTNGANLISIIPGTAYKPLGLRGSQLIFNIDSAGEKARIDSSGRLLVGTSSTVGTNAQVGVSAGTNEGIAIANSTGATRYPMVFLQGTTFVGSISTTGSATAYNTSSDYRLKENIQPLTGAIGRLQQIPVHRFNFIADPDTTVDGFIAHEAQAVVPECVTGTKDEVDDEGNPVYQGIDQSKLVPLLTAALQEALAEIESLKARLDAANL